MTITVDLTPDQIAELDKLASDTGRAKMELVQEAVTNLLAYNNWFRREVEHGLAQAERGELLDDVDVRARLDRMFRSK